MGRFQATQNFSNRRVHQAKENLVQSRATCKVHKETRYGEALPSISCAFETDLQGKNHSPLPQCLHRQAMAQK